MPTTILHGETYETALRRRFQEEAAMDRKLDWVLKRTEQILKDDDYLIQLIDQVLTDHPNLFLAIYRATFGECINVLSDLHQAIARNARCMAESEASAKVWH